MSCYITSVNENGKGIGKKVKVRKGPKMEKYMWDEILPHLVSTVLPHITTRS